MQLISSELKKLYPFQSNYFEVGGHRLHYVDEGQGEAVLLVHGNPTWSFYYRQLIQVLKQNYRVIAIDHLGHGLSDKPQNVVHTLSNHISNLTALIDHLKLDRFRMVVHDWGGAIGFGVAVNRPESLKQIVILNTAAFHINRIPWQINLCKAPVVGPFIVKYFNAFAWPATFMASKKGLSKNVKQGYLYPYPTPQDRKGIADFVQDIPMDKSHPTWKTLEHIELRLPLVTCEKLILWGGADFCFNDAFYNRWRQIYPGARSIYYAQAGHYVLEDEDQEVIGQIQNFFDAERTHERRSSNLQ